MLSSKISKAFYFANTLTSTRVFFKKRVIWLFFMICIFVPSIQESLALEEAKKPAELQNSGFVHGKVPINNVKGAGGSVSSSVSQIGQGLGKGGTEKSGSVGLPSLKVITPNKISADTAKDESSNESFDSQLSILLGFVFAVLIPLFSNYDQNVGGLSNTK
jgi:hypothetical protein